MKNTAGFPCEKRQEFLSFNTNKTKELVLITPKI